MPSALGYKLCRGAMSYYATKGK